MELHIEESKEKLDELLFFLEKFIDSPDYDRITSIKGYSEKATLNNREITLLSINPDKTSFDQNAYDELQSKVNDIEARMDSLRKQISNLRQEKYEKEEEVLRYRMENIKI